MPRLDDTAIEEGLQRLPGWQRGANQLVKTFTRADFAQAMAFVNQVAGAAEAAGHHPDIDIRWTRSPWPCPATPGVAWPSATSSWPPASRNLTNPPSPPDRAAPGDVVVGAQVDHGDDGGAVVAVAAVVDHPDLAVESFELAVGPRPGRRRPGSGRGGGRWRATGPAWPGTRRGWRGPANYPGGRRGGGRQAAGTGRDQLEHRH